MTNRLELNWKLDGFVDEQRYYCSETPINQLNLPLPKAVLAGDVRAYIDSAIETGKTYYICVGSVKNGVEKVSTERAIKADKVLNFITMRFDLVDSGSSPAIWSKVGDVAFSEINGATFTSVNQYVYQDTKFINFNLNFKISFTIRRTSQPTSHSPIFTNDVLGLWSEDHIGVWVGGSGTYLNRIFLSVSGRFYLVSSVNITNNAEFNIEVSRSGNILTLKVNNIASTYTLSTSIKTTKYLRIGYDPSSSRQFFGSIRDFCIYDV